MHQLIIRYEDLNVIFLLPFLIVGIVGMKVYKRKIIKLIFLYFIFAYFTSVIYNYNSYYNIFRSWDLPDLIHKPAIGYQIDYR